MAPPIYQFTIRTPEAQRRVERRLRIRHGVLVAGIIGALLTPGTVDELAPVACSHVWVC